MAESTRKPAESTPAAAKKPLARASESGDPEVHRIMAEMETARSNGNQEQVKALTDQLNELGYE